MERLKKRREFLAAAKGVKRQRRAFVLETLRRGDDGPPRFGFTVTKRTAKQAVERNRIRRRLKEAVRLEEHRAPRGHDHVLVGRHTTLDMAFELIRREVAEALAKAGAAARSPQ
jgi:ribonuclease P protein component